ncbi:ATP-binding protein [Streptomyces sp. NPDC055955]|uniref:ATP-binding protein n=1 Tax=Streptomyces sp. NPDC055955 TaxID=3345665 RepID=UPI0035DCAE46
MLAVALARSAVDAGHRVYVTTTAEFAAKRHKTALEGHWSTIMRSFAGPRLLVIDELGHLPRSEKSEGRNMELELLPLVGVGPLRLGTWNWNYCHWSASGHCGSACRRSRRATRSRHGGCCASPPVIPSPGRSCSSTTPPA